MGYYQCRIDDKLFYSEGECHSHVDDKHPEWGHSVCKWVVGFQCLVCDEVLDTPGACEGHLAAKHPETSDVPGSWKAVVGDD